MTAKSKAELALLGTTFIWGGTFVASKFGLEGIPPILLIAIRFSVAALFFLLIFWRKIFPLQSSLIFKGSILGLFLYLGFAAQTVGLQFTTASKSAFMTGMMVVFVPFLQVIIERRPPKLGNIFGVLIVSVGLWLLTSPAGADFNFGDALTLVCAFMFALYIVYLDVISKEMTPLQLTFIQTAATGLMATLTSLAFEDFRFSGSTQVILSMLYLTFLATVVTTYVQTRFQKDTTPIRAAIIFTIEPVFAAITAYLLLSEHLGVFGILGGALIVSGVILSEISDNVPILNRFVGLTPRTGEVWNGESHEI